MTDPTRAPEPVRPADRRPEDAGPPVDEELVQQRAAQLTAEEREAGSDDPEAQARTILEDSEARVADRDAAPGSYVERRTSDETVEPVPER